MVDTINLSELLPYKTLIRDGTVRLDGNGLMAMIEYRGVDHERTPNNDLLMLSNKVAAYIANFGRQNGWCVNHDTCLVPASPYLSGPSWTGGEVFDITHEGAPGFIDKVRGERFEGQLSDERTFFSITMRPPKAKSESLERIIKKGLPIRGSEWVSYLEDFSKAVDALVAGLQRAFAPHGWARRLDASDVLRYMAFAALGVPVESLRFPSGVRSWPFHKLFDRVLLLGRQVRIDGEPIRHVRTIGVAGAPSHHTPEMMALLSQVGHPVRISQRFTVKPADVVHNYYRQGMKEMGDEELSIWGHMMKLTPSMQGFVKPDAINMAKTISATDEAVQTALIKSGGTLTTTVAVYSWSWNDAQARADKIAELMTNELGFYAKVEGVGWLSNAGSAYAASFPGVIDRNRRGDTLPTDFIARRVRVTAPWTGPNKSGGPWGGPVIAQATTEGNIPFRFDPFSGGWGHGRVMAPNGSGKSTWLMLLGMQWKARFPKGSVRVIDANSNESTSIVPALCCGGKVMSMSSDSVQMQPLRNIDNPDIMAAKIGWIRSITDAQGIPYTDALGEAIKTAMYLLRSERPERRTMTRLYKLAPSALRSAIAAYSGDGPYAHFVDGCGNPFLNSPWTTIELGRFAKSTDPMDRPIVEALLWEIENSIDGVNPSLTIIDEGKATVGVMGEKRAVLWHAEMRKKRCVVYSCWHFVDDDMQTLMRALDEQTAYTLFFPNKNAMKEGSRKWMSPLGVTETMARQIAHAEKGQIAIIGGGHARMTDWVLGKEELAICGVNGKENNARALALYEEVGPERFWIEWLKEEGIDVDEEKDGQPAAGVAGSADRELVSA